MTRIAFTKKGNTVGFTGRGESVTGEYLSKRKAWFVSVWSANGVRTLGERNQTFADMESAIAYARTLIDETTTRRLAWWAL
jgi:hypothetical protein